MNENTFLEDYSSQYDLLYQDKDYAAECQRVIKLFEQHSPTKISSILDLGCGTGNHAFPLAEQGYKVTGIDRSEKMLAVAKEKQAIKPNLPLSFHQGDITEFSVDQKFDAAIMMFAVMGYLNTNKEIQTTLQLVQQHIKPGGLFIFDVWYGPAVLAIRPSDRVKVIPIPKGQLIRSASGSLDVNQNLCQVSYQMWLIEGTTLMSETEETHQMRYFFQPELACLLGSAGFELVHISSADELQTPAGENTWNVLGAARSKAA